MSMLVPPEPTGVRDTYETRLAALLLLAFAGSAAVMARGLVTPLGGFSFGRVWMYEISYRDFGFLKRSFVGTVIDLMGLDVLLPHVGVRAHVVHLAAIAAVLGVVALFALRRRPPLWAVAVLALSPAFVLQSAYTTGTLDVYLLLVMTVVVLARPRTWIAVLLCAIGVLVHELFVFGFLSSS